MTMNKAQIKAKQKRREFREIMKHQARPHVSEPEDARKGLKVLRAKW